MANSKHIESNNPVPSSLIKPREEVKELLEAQIVAANPILEIQVPKKTDYSYDIYGVRHYRRETYEKDAQDEFFRQYHVWDNRCKEIFTRSFADPNNTDLAAYEQTGVSYFIKDVIEEQKSHIRDKIAYIQGFIQRLDLIPCSPESTPSSLNVLRVDKMKVFVVHGHNDALKIEVARTIEKMGLKAIILHEQEDNGNTIIEKFEKNASDVGFAVILLTGDDRGVSQKDLEREKKEIGFNAELKSRARQNVVFEMGYFIGKLGRAHVFELLESGVEKPGDLDGIIYTSVDDEGIWKFKLAKRLSSLGYPIKWDAIT